MFPQVSTPTRRTSTPQLRTHPERPQRGHRRQFRYRHIYRRRSGLEVDLFCRYRREIVAFPRPPGSRGLVQGRSPWPPASCESTVGKDDIQYHNRRTNVPSCAILPTRYESGKSGTEAPNGTCRRVIRGNRDWLHLKLPGGHAPPSSGTPRVRSSQSVQVCFP